MIFAELHGKLGENYSRAHERSEDLLTSTVFGLLRYVSPQEGHLALLGRARRVRLGDEGWVIVGPADDWLPSTEISRVETKFWPYTPEYGEPDVLLTFTDAAGDPKWSVLVEAKLHASKSGRANEDDVLTDPEAPDPDQLVRYWRLLLGLEVARRGASPMLIYLTRHSTPPSDELAASLRREPGMELAWLSWRDVWAVVSRVAATSLPAADLARLLAHKGLKRFDGFHSDPWHPPPVTRFWTGSGWFRRLQPWAGIKLGTFWAGGR